MTEKSSAIVGAVAGALIGAAAGFMFFSERGRAFTRDLEPLMDEFAEELNHFRGTAQKAANVANQGWRLVNETFSGGGPRFADPHQTSPF
jgi:gas vesicle protein